jgi:outer membrane receptor for ferrienterochelin and colicin
VSLYYTVIKDIDDDVNQGPAPGIPGAQQVGFVNSNQAIARGAEAQLKYRLTPRRSVYANYTYEHLTDRSGNVGEVTKNTPAHAANFGAMTDLPRGFSASFNLGYKDNYLIANQAQVLAVPAYWRLDARLAWTPPWYKNATIFLAGQNLLKDQHREFADGLAVPRTYSGGVSIKFNGRD